MLIYLEKKTPLPTWLNITFLGSFDLVQSKARYRKYWRLIVQMFLQDRSYLIKSAKQINWAENANRFLPTQTSTDWEKTIKKTSLLFYKGTKITNEIKNVLIFHEQTILLIFNPKILFSRLSEKHAIHTIHMVRREILNFELRSVLAKIIRNKPSETVWNLIEILSSLDHFGGKKYYNNGEMPETTVNPSSWLYLRSSGYVNAGAIVESILWTTIIRIQRN